MKKRCNICNKTKLLDEFNKNAKAKDGHASRCRLCANGYDREYLQNSGNAERARKRANAHYWNNRDKKRQQVATYQLAQKQKAVAVKGGKCERCGFAHPAALQFHHRDPSTKVFMLSSKTLAMPKKFPWEVVLDEIAKCDLLCANCHAIEHNTWVLS